MSKKTITIFLIAVFAASSAGQVKTGQVMPPDFKSDGCSMFPDGNYRECCFEHDKAYYFGGSLKQRRAADKELFRCVRSKRNGKLLASIIYVGVRVGGVSFLPTPFRWGFGNKFPRKEPKRPKQPTATPR